MRCYCGTSEVSLVGSCDLCKWAPPPTHCFPYSIVITEIVRVTIVTLNDSICDRILENSSKSHMKSSVFLHVFNDISTYVYVFKEYFLHFSVI